MVLDSPALNPGSISYEKVAAGVITGKAVVVVIHMLGVVVECAVGLWRP